MRSLLPAARQRLCRRVFPVMLGILSIWALGGCSTAAPGSSPEFPAAFEDLSLQAGQAIAPAVVLPSATGGAGRLAYSLRGEIPPGLTFDAGSRELRGTPTDAGTYSVTYEVTDASRQTANLTFSIVVAAAEEDATAPDEPPDVPEPPEPATPPEPGTGTPPVTGAPPATDGTFDYRGHGDQVFALNPDGASLADAVRTLNLGGASADVYLIATNSTAGATSPEVTISGSVTVGHHHHARPPRRAPGALATKPAWVVEFNNNAPLPRATAHRAAHLRWHARQASGARGDRFTFAASIDSETIGGVAATARAVVTDGSITATFWVGDADWGDGCSGAGPCVTQAMVDAMAAGFLQSGAGNDIYDWVTAVFGVPWGPHGNSSLIPPAAAQNIHILLYDIDEDGIPAPGTCRVAGYFSAANNYLAASISGSAERLTFFMDSPLFATPEDATWEVTDRRPSQIMSVLAHEFQHMIHFYQKRVLHGASRETWLNEMASEVAQDLISTKLMANGPRGVAYDDPTAGAPGIERGRLPIYNLYNDLQVTAWGGDLADYAIVYALGAYLARTYGAGLFSEIVQNDESGTDAVEAALVALGHNVSFPQVLANWAAANLLSDNTAAPARYRYNPGTWTSSQAGGQTYRLGSINLYNYRYEPPDPVPDCYGPDVEDHDTQEGPFLHSLSDFNGLTLAPHSNTYATMGRHTGTVQVTVRAASGVRIALVVKE